MVFFFFDCQTSTDFLDIHLPTFRPNVSIVMPSYFAKPEYMSKWQFSWIFSQNSNSAITPKICFLRLWRQRKNEESKSWTKKKEILSLSVVWLLNWIAVFVSFTIILFKKSQKWKSFFIRLSDNLWSLNTTCSSRSALPQKGRA